MSNNKFLNPIKSIIYLSILILGLILKLFDLPTSNTIILSSIGLFLGHVVHNSIWKKGFFIMKVVLLSLVVGVVLLTLIIYYYTLAAVIVLIMFAFVSFLLDFIKPKSDSKRI